MRTQLLRALGSNGVVYIVFCRVPRSPHKLGDGRREKWCEPRYYLGNGDLLLYDAAHRTLKTQAGDLVLRLCVPAQQDEAADVIDGQPPARQVRDADQGRGAG